METDEFLKEGRKRLLAAIEDRRILAKEGRLVAAELNAYGAPADVIAALLESANEADRVANELDSKGPDWIVLPPW
jgi:hypothetical protein